MQSKSIFAAPPLRKYSLPVPGWRVATELGLNNDAVQSCRAGDLLTWADVIFVMEKAQRNKLFTKKFKAFLTTQRLICLDIPHDYDYMDPMSYQNL